MSYRQVSTMSAFMSPLILPSHRPCHSSSHNHPPPRPRRVHPRATAPPPTAWTSTMPTPAVTPLQLETAEKALDAASEIVMRHFREPVSAAYKSDETPVTVADREAEEVIRNLIQSTFPSHTVVGEELTGAVSTSADFVWVIDPIDGTRAFLTGRPTFTILLALVYQGTPILGCVHQPVTNERWVGVVGKPTTLNGRVVRVREAPALADATVQATTPHMFMGLDALAFRAVVKETRNVVYGGDAYAYAMLASGCADLVIEADLKPWDMLALVPVVKGAGGVITDWMGNEISLMSDGRVVAAGSEQLAGDAIGALLSVDDDAINAVLPGSQPISAPFTSSPLPEDPGPGHIESMTGFGEASVVEGNASAKVQIRSVNSRYCEVQIRAPRIVQSIEAELVALTKKQAVRGKIVVIVEIGNGGGEPMPVVNQEAAKRVGGLLREVSEAAGVSGVGVSDVLAFSEVLKKEGGEGVEVDFVKEAVAMALDNVAVARRREGAILERDLMKRTKRIRGMLKEIESRLPRRVERERARLKKLVEGHRVEESRLDEMRLEQEVTIHADKIDVSEEVVRLGAHVGLFEMTMMGVDEPVGVRLGFLLQEMHREANTLGGKAADAPISHMCVLIKEEIEKIREQCQNIR